MPVDEPSGCQDALIAPVTEPRRAQEIERATAAQLWVDGDWLFTTPTGEPINPRTDYDEWTRLLAAAGLRDGLHNARHSAATVLLLLGVPERTVMGIMGWLVNDRHGRPLPAHHGADQAGRSAQSRWPTLGKNEQGQ